MTMREFAIINFMNENNFRNFEENITPEALPTQRLAWWHHLLFFLGGYFFLIFLNEVVTAGLSTVVPESNEILGKTLSSLIVYATTFTVFALLLWVYKVFGRYFRGFLALTPYLKGIFYGFVVIIASVTYNVATILIFGQRESNTNQQAIEGVIAAYPFLNFFWIVLFGPLVEEFLYRIGLFGGLRKINRVVAYIVSGLIFGFMHFTIPFDANGGIIHAELINEFINIPSYIISGLLFAYIFDKEGFATSATAHITNNLISFIVTMIGIYAT